MYPNSIIDISNNIYFEYVQYLYKLENNPTSGGSVLRSKVGSIPGRACRPSRSVFFVVFSETHVNMVWDTLERPPTEGTPHIHSIPTNGQLTLTL